MAAGASEDRAFRDRMARIESLIERLKSAGDPELRARALEAVRLLMELHGAGFGRVMGVVEKAGEPGRAIAEEFARDELIGSLLLLYGLHPTDLETRVRQALDKVRPYLRSHGGDVELAGIREGSVHLRLQGSCKGCPSSAMTLRLAVEDAVYEAAPEVAEVVAEGSTEPVFTQHPANGHAPAAEIHGWEEIEGWAALADGAVQAVEAGGRRLILCRRGESYYAYAAVCPGCGSAMAGGRIEDRNVVCPGCSRPYDLMLAGRSLDDSGLRLEPFPLLVSEGRARIALAREPGHPEETQGGV